MQKQQFRKWIYAGVAVVLLLILSLSQLDKEKLYQTLQTQLAASGIQLKAQSLSLSAMYMGSVHLDDVHIESSTFEVDANRLFIDLDLAALLTGKAIAQALYLQDADINITQESQDDWLNLLKNDAFKLKRIDISQSEIHFEQQHLTLEKVDLDIRDIGKNKSPRLELRAHIGDGRIDAHGYLHIKRGKITKGFGRVKLFDIPLNNWNQGTTIQSLSGSITSHLNQDASWQSFGHLSLQTDSTNPIEVRAKILGDNATFLSIDEMVINHKDMGAVQISGQCSQQNQCDFVIGSQRLEFQPLLSLFQNKNNADVALENIVIQTHYKQGQWQTDASMLWPDFDYIQNKEESSIHIQAGNLQVSKLNWSDMETWSAQNIALFSGQRSSPEIDMDYVSFSNHTLTLPLNFHATNFWLPLAQWLQPDIKGKGVVDGHTNLEFKSLVLTKANIELDASHAEIHFGDLYKPQNTNLILQGKLLWEEDKLPDYAEVDIKLAKSTFSLRHEKTRWHFSGMEINFDQLKESNIHLPKPWQSWHGYIRGETTFYIPKKSVIIEQADVDLIQFGKDNHMIDGQIQTDGKTWQVQNLRWTQGKNSAEFFGGTDNRFDIEAESLNAQALVLLQSLPFQPHGNINSKALRLPFGTLSQVSLQYHSKMDVLQLQTFKSKFYEGTLTSEEINVSPVDNAVSMRGTIQVGGIHLNNWLWLHKQFGTHLEATIYATLNLEAAFDTEQHLQSWTGDGEVSIYNGVWLLNNKNIKADKVNLTLRKRKEFNATYAIKNGRNKGKGTFRIDTNKAVSGELNWLGETYIFTKSWPKFRYQSVNENNTLPQHP